MLILCLSLIDATRRVIAQNSLSEAEYFQYMPEQPKTSVDIHMYSIGMFSYPYISKGHFQPKICISLLETTKSQSDSGPHCARCHTNTHSAIYCLCTTSVSIQASFPYHLYDHHSSILWSDTVRLCLPNQQFRDLSALIFCVLPVLEMLC